MSPDEDNNKEGLHLFPYCQISKRYFPVVRLHHPISPLSALGGISVTCQNNVSAASLFSHFMLSSLIPRTESLALWRSWGVYLAQDFNHYKTDSAESICLNLIQSAYQVTPDEEGVLPSLRGFGNWNRPWNASSGLDCTKKDWIWNEIKIKA